MKRNTPERISPVTAEINASSLTHAQLLGVRNVIPTATFTLTSIEGNSHRLTDKELYGSFIDSKGRQMQQEWYELYPEASESSVTPIITYPVLKRAHEELTLNYSYAAAMTSRTWNSLEDGAKLAKRGLVSSALLDFLIVEEKEGSPALPNLNLHGIYAHELAELAERTAEFKVPSFTRRESSTRAFLANFANTLLVHQSS